MRNFMKCCVLLSILAVCAFGGFTLKDEVYRFLPQRQIAEPTKQPQTETTDKTNADEQAKPTFQHPQLFVDGELTEGTTNIAFIHEKGFEVGKDRYKDTTDKPSVQNDDKKRLYRYSVRIAPDDAIMYPGGPEQGPTEPQTFAKDAPAISVTNHTWRYALQPYLSAISDFVKTNDLPVVLVAECRYNTLNDTVPHYVDIKAFTPDDLGQSCNIWVTFYNTDPTRQLDYVSGQWLPTTVDGEKEAVNG